MPRIRPTIDAKFNFILKESISRLKPIGPVRLDVMICIWGINLTIRFPRAEPKTAPRIINAIK
jgi:hypothetical protein